MCRILRRMRRTQTLNAATSVASHMLIVLWCWIMRRVHMAVPGRCIKYVHHVNSMQVALVYACM